MTLPIHSKMDDRINSFILTFKKIGKTLFYFFVLLFVLSLFWRRFNNDEGIIGEWAYWFALKGHAASLLYTDYMGVTANNIHIYHKIYTWILAAIIKVFGFHLFPMRMVSLIAFLALIILTTKYLNKNNSLFKPLWIVGLLYLIHPLVFNFAFVARPELIMTLLCFGVFYSLDKYLIVKHQKWAAFAGFLAGLSFSTHLNGIAIMAAGGLFLLFYMEWKAVFVYGFVAFAFAQLFFLDIPSGYSGFLQELSHSPDVSQNSFSLISMLLNVSDEHQRFFHNLELSLFSLMFVLSIVFTLKAQWLENKSVMLFLALIVLSLSALTHGKTNKYLLYYLPFMILILINAINHLYKQQKMKALCVLIVMGTLSGIATVHSYLSEYQYFIQVEQRNIQLAKQIEKGSTVLVHDGFVFGGLDHYKLRSPIIFFFTHPKFNEKSAEATKEYFQFAAMYHYDYVAIDMLLERDEIRRFIRSEKLNIGDHISAYELIYKDNDFLVFKNIELVQPETNRFLSVERSLATEFLLAENM